MFPFPPNWRDRVTVVSEYKTDIITSRSGREQRRAARGEPRKTLKFSILAAYADYRRFMRLLTTSQNQPLQLADPTRYRTLESNIASGGSTVTVDAVPAWLGVGQSVQLERGSSAATAQISAVSGTTITFAAPVTQTWPIGTRIRPLLTVRLDTQVSATAATNNVVEAAMNFTVTPGSEPYDPGQPQLYIHNGREVFPFTADWSTSPMVGSNWDTETIDYGYGRVATYTPVQFPTFIYQYAFVNRSADDIAEMQGFFDRMKGRRGEFYMPSGMEDMVLAATIPVDATTITVQGSDVHDADDAVLKAVCLRTPDGRMIFRSITATVVNGDGNTVLTLDSPIEDDIPQATVSWMPVCRFASDQLTLEYVSDSVAQTQLLIQSVEDLTPENAIDPYDGAAEWLLEAWGVFPELDLLDRVVNVLYPEAVA